MKLNRPTNETFFYCIGIFFPSTFFVMDLIGVGDALLSKSPPNWVLAGQFLMSSIPMLGVVAYISWRRFDPLRRLVSSDRAKYIFMGLVGMYAYLQFAVWYFGPIP